MEQAVPETALFCLSSLRSFAHSHFHSLAIKTSCCCKSDRGTKKQPQCPVFGHKSASLSPAPPIGAGRKIAALAAFSPPPSRSAATIDNWRIMLSVSHLWNTRYVRFGGKKREAMEGFGGSYSTTDGHARSLVRFVANIMVPSGPSTST